MINFNIYCKDKESVEKQIAIVEANIEQAIYQPETAKYIFVFGGDGTFLEAINKFGTAPIYIPINTGTLGFYASWNYEDFALVNEVIGKHKEEIYPLLYVDIYEAANCQRYYGINEMTIINPVRTQILDIYERDILFEKIRTTGICVATSSGSTAYNKSLGGAIMSLNSELFQLTKIAPINNVKYRSVENPIIFNKGQELIFKDPINNFANSILTCDRQNKELTNCQEIHVGISDKQIKVIQSHEMNFMQRVKAAFIIDM